MALTHPPTLGLLYLAGGSAWLHTVTPLRDQLLSVKWIRAARCLLYRRMDRDAGWFYHPTLLPYLIAFISSQRVPSVRSAHPSVGIKCTKQGNTHFCKLLHFNNLHWNQLFFLFEWLMECKKLNLKSLWPVLSSFQPFTSLFVSPLYISLGNESKKKCFPSPAEVTFDRVLRVSISEHWKLAWYQVSEMWFSSTERWDPGNKRDWERPSNHHRCTNWANYIVLQNITASHPSLTMFVRWIFTSSARSNQTWWKAGWNISQSVRAQNLQLPFHLSGSTVLRVRLFGKERVRSETY